jgi:Nif11 domain
MAREDFEQFKQIVLQNFSLREKLRGFGERDELIAKVIEIGEEYGFLIMREDVEEVLRENSRLWIERWI